MYCYYDTVLLLWQNDPKMAEIITKNDLAALVSVQNFIVLKVITNNSYENVFDMVLN